MRPCYHNLYHPMDAPCSNVPRWRGHGTNNVTDDWTWCDEHAPSIEWRVPLESRSRFPSDQK
jgi:hypothetical protein